MSHPRSRLPVTAYSAVSIEEEDGARYNEGDAAAAPVSVAPSTLRTALVLALGVLLGASLCVAARHGYEYQLRQRVDAESRGLDKAPTVPSSATSTMPTSSAFSPTLASTPSAAAPAPLVPCLHVMHFQMTSGGEGAGSQLHQLVLGSIYYRDQSLPVFYRQDVFASYGAWGDTFRPIPPPNPTTRLSAYYFDAPFTLAEVMDTYPAWPLYPHERHPALSAPFDSPDAAMSNYPEAICRWPDDSDPGSVYPAPPTGAGLDFAHPPNVDTHNDWMTFIKYGLRFGYLLDATAFDPPLISLPPPVIYLRMRRWLYRIVQPQPALLTEVLEWMGTNTIRPRWHPMEIINSTVEIDAHTRSYPRYLAMHVRRQDKSSEAAPISTSAYLEALDAIIAHDRETTRVLNNTWPDGQPRVFISTDEPSVVEEMRTLRPTWIFLTPPSFGAPVRKGAHSWADVSLTERAANLRSLVFSLLVFMHADHLLCTTSSNICRISTIGRGWRDWVGTSNDTRGPRAGELWVAGLSQGLGLGLPSNFADGEKRSTSLDWGWLVV